MDFVAIDFETATSKRSSACALGVAVVKGGAVAGKGRWLVRPPDNEYDGFNVALHEITPEMTAGAPTLGGLWAEVLPYIEGQNLVAHNAGFDISVLRHSLDLYNIPYPSCTYYCTRILSRSHWDDMSSYALSGVARRCGISFEHHEPADDAYAAAAIALSIAGERGCPGLYELAEDLRVQPGRLGPNGYSACQSRAGSRKAIGEYVASTDAIDPKHEFYGSKVVFTGTMRSMTRDQAIQALVDLGGVPATAVSSKTDYLVVGDEDYKAFTKEKPSGKLKKAMEVRESGGRVVIISEWEFLQLL